MKRDMLSDMLGHVTLLSQTISAKSVDDGQKKKEIGSLKYVYWKRERQR